MPRTEPTKRSWHRRSHFHLELKPGADDNTEAFVYTDAVTYPADVADSMEFDVSLMVHCGTDPKAVANSLRAAADLVERLPSVLQAGSPLNLKLGGPLKDVLEVVANPYKAGNPRALVYPVPGRKGGRRHG